LEVKSMGREERRSWVPEKISRKEAVWGGGCSFLHRTRAVNGKGGGNGERGKKCSFFGEGSKGDPEKCSSKRRSSAMGTRRKKREKDANMN